MIKSVQECCVLVSGMFNLVHVDHVRLFEFASKYGSVTVGINNDPYVQKKYGDLAIPLLARSYMLRSIRFVDKVVVFDEDDPSQLILQLRPKYYVKGPDYIDKQLPEIEAIRTVGSQLVFRREERQFSSSDLIRRIPMETLKRFI